MTLKYAKHTPVSLRQHPTYSEAWLHDRICDDPSILGLGDLRVIERERTQAAGGRLDILFSDLEANRRYEVEIMLGATDPSHIIRCIEYWDIERRRYPAHDHVAVLVAEQVTTRFLNVMGLLAGSIPLIAIQLSALSVGDQLVRNFVKVLDQQMLREDDDSGGEAIEVGRDYWEQRKGTDSLALCDRLLSIANEFLPEGSAPFEMKYTKTGVAIAPHGSFFNVVRLWPKKGFVRLQVIIANSTEWQARFDDVGLDCSTRGSRIQVAVHADHLDRHNEMLRELIQGRVHEFLS